MGWFGDNIWGPLTQGTGLSSLLGAGITTAGLLAKEDDPVAYQNTQAGFEAAQALSRDELAQRLEIARMQMASAGAGSGAAVAAAKIAAAVQYKALKEKAMADALAARLGGEQLRQQTQTANNAQRVGAANALGQAGQQGFGTVAQILASGRR
jgi:hypothetical protein